MPNDSTKWVVIIYRRHADCVLQPEVIEVGDEITAQRYFDKLSAGIDHVRLLQAHVTRSLGKPSGPGRDSSGAEWSRLTSA